MLDERGLGGGEGEEDADGAVGTGYVELAAEPVFGYHRARGGAAAGLLFQGGDFGAALGDGGVEEEVHGRDLVGFGVGPVVPQIPDMGAHFGERFRRRGFALLAAAGFVENVPGLVDCLRWAGVGERRHGEDADAVVR